MAKTDQFWACRLGRKWHVVRRSEALADKAYSIASCEDERIADQIAAAMNGRAA